MQILFLIWLMLLCTMALGMSAKFRNLSNRQVRIFWIPGGGGEPVLQQYVPAGKEISFQTYATHRFWFCEDFGPIQPIDTPGAQNSEIVISKSQLIYPFMDDTTSPDLIRKMNEELDFMASHYNKTGQQWLAYYPRNPPKFPMWPAEYIGKIYTIPLSKESARILCNQKLPNCIHSVSPDGPNSLEVKVLTVHPRSYVIDNFLSDYECDFIINSSLPHLIRSETVMGGRSRGVKGISKTRTSSSYFISRSHSDVTEAITRRLADLVQIPHEKLHLGLNGESLNVLRYLPGQEYTPHYDWWISDGPQMRFASAILYFNTPDMGGETSFPIGINEDGSKYVKLKAKKRRALMFYNVLPDGNADKYSLHSGEKVILGEKFAGAYWTWDPSSTGRDDDAYDKHKEL